MRFRWRAGRTIPLRVPNSSPQKKPGRKFPVRIPDLPGNYLLLPEKGHFMAKRILLEVRSEPAWFTLTGISCHLKDYRISYLLNEQLRFCLTKLEDVPLTPEGFKETAFFSLYRHRDPDQCNTDYLVGNRNPEHLLLP